MALRGLTTKSLAVGLALALAPCQLSAGVIEGVKTVDDLTVYLGVVPAAIVRGHKAELKMAVHGGFPRSSVHNVHVVVAVFNKDSGTRLHDIQVRARFHQIRAKEHGTTPTSWSMQLKPMTVNGALTYGAFTNLGGWQDVSISVDVIRRSKSPRQRVTTAQFEYSHD